MPQDSATNPFDLASIPGLPHETLPVLRRLWTTPTEAPESLADAVRLHVKAVDDLARRNEFLDPRQAQDLAATCLALLQQLEPDTPLLHRKLTELAVRYFVLEHDADSDFDIAGLDDDIAVVHAIASYLESL